jgi:hypothetical protein
MLTTLNFAKFSIIAISSLTMSSCAMWQKLKPDAELAPATQANIACRTSNFDTAYACAFAAHAELSELVDDVGDYNRSSSYAAWLLATATGGVLAFDGGKSALKGLAVGAGGLIGLNTVVNTDQQLKAITKAKIELGCVMSVSQQIHQAGKSPSIVGLNGAAAVAVQRLDSNRQQALSAAMVAPATVKSEMEKYRAATEDLQFKAISKASSEVANSVIGADANIGLKLSNAIFSIRDRLRAELAGMAVNDEKSMMDQRNHVVDMAGEIIRKRAEVRKKSDAAPVSSDPAQAGVAEVAQQALNGSIGIEQSFKECVDPSTVDALRG